MDGRPNSVDSGNASSLEGIMETPPSYWKIINYESSCTSAMANYFIRRKSHGSNHPHQMEHEDHLVMIMAHTYTHLLLVEGG